MIIIYYYSERSMDSQVIFIGYLVVCESYYFAWRRYMKAEEKLIAKWVFDMLVQEGLITERIKEQALKIFIQSRQKIQIYQKLHRRGYR